MQHIFKSGYFTALILGVMTVAGVFLAERRASISTAGRLTLEVRAGVSPARAVPTPRTSAGGEDFPQPAATVTDTELLQMARQLVARSPELALAWAGAQTDAVLRARMRFAVVRAWGEGEPRAAVYWALRQEDSAREADMRAALTGAAIQPDTAMQIARELLVDDPENGGAYAAMLAGALSADGKYQAAIRFLNSASSPDLAASVSAIFSRWAASQPQAALDALDTITDPQLRAAAFHEITATWCANDPGGLAAYAEAMPAGDDREQTLNLAMQNWSLQDPAGLAGWLNTLPAGADFDAGVAMMIARTDGANRPPELAMEWVENMSDPALRQDSLQRVVNEWNQSDPAALRQYVANATWLGGEQREAILKSLGAE